MNSKYILKSTLTPKLARKELMKGSNSGLHKSHSCSSLQSANLDSSTNPQYNNYLTVHVSIFFSRKQKECIALFLVEFLREYDASKNHDGECR